METAEEPQGGKRAYFVSSVLHGHRDDVRSLAVPASSASAGCTGPAAARLFSTSRDSLAKSWTRDGDDNWVEERTFTGHEGYVNASTWMANPHGSGDFSDSQGYLVTGGQDTIINVYNLASDSSEPEHTLLGHVGNVCSLHSVGSRIVSGSWDYTARIWDVSKPHGNGGEWATCTAVLTGHGAAVWDVLALGLKGYEECALTACADGLIRMFNIPSSTSEPVQLFKGHKGPVRALAKLLPEDPECNLFASCSNDCHILVWDILGNLLTTLKGHESFIYALASIPTSMGGGLASSGEEGIVKIWDEEEGEEEQEILVPCDSVWDLAILSNGDLAIACSDNCIWIFTRDVTRRADPALSREYHSRLAALKRPHQSTRTSSDLPLSSAEELSEPGEDDGEVKLVTTQEGKTVAHRWNGNKWIEIGEVVTGENNDEVNPERPESKLSIMHEGKEYDVVIDIDVKDNEPPLKLPYLYTDTPRKVAEEFVERHELPDSYVDRISDYLNQLRQR